jgi:hypothetical protein
MSQKKDLAVLLAGIAPFILLAATLFVQSGPEAMLYVAEWFDPVFFQYNLIIMLLAILVVPLVTYFYTTNMKHEKTRRLKGELSPEQWEKCKDYVHELIARQFRMRNYSGSMTVLVVLVAVGMSIILLLKPQPLKAIGATFVVNGLDYNKGANFLLLGPYIEAFIDGRAQDYYKQLAMSLAAFQFGFLGAYVYFIAHLTRSYFTLDLTPNTFVNSSVRMATGSLLALVIAFALPALPFFGQEGPAHVTLNRFLPLLSFFIGYFPSRGLLAIEKISTKILPSAREDYAATSLTELQGMSYAHEVRLRREGYDNIDNLAHTDPLALALRTGFSYRQLRQWVGEAKLRAYMGKDFNAFRSGTGISSAYDVVEFIHRPDSQQKLDVYEQLGKATGNKFDEKIHIVGDLLDNLPGFTT